MCQAESPQTQIRRSVRDASQAELNGVNGLQYEDVTGALFAIVLRLVLCAGYVMGNCFNCMMIESRL